MAEKNRADNANTGRLLRNKLPIIARIDFTPSAQVVAAPRVSAEEQ
ncbi:MAG: hypothetical protein PHU78_07075 [Heliobacteriaceae bacterium]|nr:hypothetical protein [Heliobacteriaceae bacterium]